MKLSQLNLLLDSGIPITCINAPVQERMTVLSQIYLECGVQKNLPVYLWNLGWSCFKQVKYSSELQVYFSHMEWSDLNHSNEAIFTAFDSFVECGRDGIFILENLPNLMNGALSGCSSSFSGRIISQLVNIYYELKTSRQLQYLIILTTDDAELPQSLSSLIPTLFTSLPSHQEVVNLIKDLLPELTSVLQHNVDLSDLVNAASGLTTEEIRLGLNQADNYCNQSNSNTLTHHLLEYKINRFRSFNLNFVAKPSIPDFGGLDLLKQYIKNVKLDFSEQARKKNIPLPRGCLLVGPPGTGKTYSAHVSAKVLGFPLVNVDTAVVVSGGAIYLKRLLERVEACAPIVLYFDEFDKLFAASNSSGEDMGSRQILGILLTWLQDKKSAVFAIATLNRLDALPPELTRVGRFDEIFYVGFPQAIERQEILQMHLARFDERYCCGSNVLSEKEWRIILNKTVNCTGAELARMVEKAARKLFHEGGEIKIGVEELLEQREGMVPLYVRDTERILAIENRAKYFCQPASSPDTSVFAPAIASFWGESRQ
ncbi:MAG: AAA family ATPase [Nostocaceae cyanobacterium]|nr:AAA family ATPase [Nostocaceae cyanobacterium]